MATKKPKSAQQPIPAATELIHVGAGSLMDRVVSILEQSRGNVVRAVNSNMVIAYWLIGREIVEALQGGEERAEYGQRVLDELSKQLTERYGKGFSTVNLRHIRLFINRLATGRQFSRHCLLNSVRSRKLAYWLNAEVAGCKG